MVDDVQEPPPGTATEAAVAAARGTPPADDPWKNVPTEVGDEDGAPVGAPIEGDPWAAAEAEAAAAAAAKGAKPAAATTTEGAEGAKPNEGAEGDEVAGDEAEAIAAEAAAAAAAGTALAEPVTLQLPTFDDDGEEREPVEFETDDPVIVSTFNDLVVRASEADATVNDARTRAAQALEERDAFLVELRADPVATISRSLETTESRQQFVLQFLQDDALRAAVLPVLETWDADPKERELAAARFENSKGKRKEAADRWAAEQRFIRDWNETAFDEVAKLIPRGLDAATRALCVRDATTDIQAAITANNGEYIDPATIKTVLARRVELWRGIAPARSPKKAPTPAASTPSTPAARPPAPAKPAAAPSAEEIERAKATPAAVKRAVLRRRVLTASTPATRAAAPVAGAEAPDLTKMGTKEVIAHLRGKK